MTKNNQKIILALVIMLLVITSIVAIFISSNINDNNEENINNTKPIINMQISRLTDFDEFYAVQNTINTIFSNIGKPDELIKYFDNGYLISNNLNETNILNYLKVNMDNYTVTIEEIYYNDNSDITYYFIKSYIMQYSMLGDTNYEKDKYYLLIVDNNNHYSLKPLDNISNLEEYANYYSIEDITIDNDSKFEKNEIENETKIIAYINNFNNLMFIDLEKAYNMLDDETKKIYLNLDSFNSNLENINNNLFTKFSATSIKENENNNVYKVQDYKHRTITITEYYPNEYKIGFKFN